jgi:hypothetical protein
MLLFASKRIISVFSIALVALSQSGIAGENLQPRLVKWRDHSTAISGSEARVLIERQFATFDPNYTFEKKRFGPEITAAAKEIAENEWRGRAVPCSRQIYLEAKWLWGYTAFFGKLAELLNAFAESLKVEDQSFTNLQSPFDGGWGVCYRRMANRLDATVTALEELHARDEGPEYALRLYPEIKTGAQFRHAIESLILSDIPTTGENLRGTLNSVITSLGRVHLRRHWRDFVEQRVRAHLHEQLPGGVPEVEARVVQFINDWQDPETGFWGAWYRDGDQIYRTSDLSITFHIVSYRNGQVDRKVAIGEHLLASKYENYPYGWFKDGQMSNHNNYDVVKIIRLIWGDLPDALKEKFRIEIEKMTIWALQSSLQQDGSVKFYPTMFESASAEYYYLVSFLEEIGFWNADKQFWIGKDASEIPYSNDPFRVCSLIKRSFDQRRFQDGPSLATRQKLTRSCPDKF